MCSSDLFCSERSGPDRTGPGKQGTTPATASPSATACRIGHTAFNRRQPTRHHLITFPDTPHRTPRAQSVGETTRRSAQGRYRPSGEPISPHHNKQQPPQTTSSSRHNAHQRQRPSTVADISDGRPEFSRRHLPSEGAQVLRAGCRSTRHVPPGASPGGSVGWGPAGDEPARGTCYSSSSARARRAASSSASRAATLAACCSRAASMTSSIGPDRSSCSSLAARETAAAATRRFLAM